MFERILLKLLGGIDMLITYKDRCSNCYALVEGEKGEWICDLFGHKCNDIEICGEWTENIQYSKIVRI